MLLKALLATIILLSAGVAFSEIESGSVPDPDDAVISYSYQPTTDSIAALNQEIRAGRKQLKFDGDQGYLRSVLDALRIPVESQMAIFSKTSLQAPLINRHNPRTLFFNDAVAVGWVRGGFIEVAAQDPRQGVIFYTLAQSQVENPQFIRHTDDCLQCHLSNDASGVPGMLVRSQLPAPSGIALRELGNYISDHRSPFEERWGGWYVTGNTGSIKHMGNKVVTDAHDPDSLLTEQTLNLSSLKDKFATDSYLSPYSDIVALMVFDHQMHMMNLLTRIGWQARSALNPGNPHDVLSTDIRGSARELVDYMLFVDEAPLTDKIVGTSGFAERFSAEGPRDSQGRSLRQLDLDRHLMRYPCSYMIYSDLFDALPSIAKDEIYQRMWQVLSGEVKDVRYERLALADRQAVVEILRDTKPGLPKYFGTVTD